jgi:hypothetical protein
VGLQNSKPLAFVQVTDKGYAFTGSSPVASLARMFLYFATRCKQVSFEPSPAGSDLCYKLLKNVDPNEAADFKEVSIDVSLNEAA